MNCPNCTYGPLPENAHYCPNCSQPVAIASRVDIRQDVKQNLGRVIGVQTEAIHGDVYGGDIYQVQLYVLSEAGRGEAVQRFHDAQAAPYKFLAPYGLKDRALFKGRQLEIQQAIGHIGQGRLLVLYGQSGAGKSSLLAAGIIPALAEAGALTVHIRDYDQPLDKSLRAALAASADQLPLGLPQQAGLSALIQSVATATQGTVILALDQFEALFSPTMAAEQRASWISALVESLRVVEPEFLRLILAVRDEALVKLTELQEALPDLFRAFMEVRLLSREQARAAILEPLGEVSNPIYFDEGLVEELLIPDLDELTPQAGGQIHPAHLQIVCHRLYQAAVGRQPPLVGQKLYLEEARGADGILARYLDETLRTHLADQQELAQKLLISMAAPGAGQWLSAEQLPGEGLSTELASGVLDRLVAAELLVQRPSNGHVVYAFTSQMVAEEVRRLAGPDLERSHQAQAELERIWSAWLADDELASSGQLRRLTKSGAHLRPAAVKSLLLLRSAVTFGEPAGAWLNRLRSEEGRALVRELEGIETGDPAFHVSRTQKAEAQRLLGLVEVDGPLPDRGPDEGAESPYGPVARASVLHRGPGRRQTNALALLAPDRFVALSRLDWALQSNLKGAMRLWRKAELRGVMAEADLEVDALNAALPAIERGAIRTWRIQRRLFLERQRLAALILGGAIGAGLSLGILRFFTALLTLKTPGLYFLLNLVYGALLIAGLLAGKLLAEYSLLRQTRVGAPLESEASRKARPSWTAYGLVVLLGALFFGLVHLLVMATSGSLSFADKGQVAAIGFAAGLAMSLALVALPIDSLWLSRRRWASRVVVTAMLFALLQGIFIATDNIFRSLVIIWPAAGYRADLTRYANSPGWEQFIELFPDPAWYSLIAVLDAALVGVVLTFGLLIGLHWAARAHTRWQALLAQADSG